jgi:hypothetical protein
MVDHVAGANYKKIYHITSGPAVLAELDALHALHNFPAEWLSVPWPERAADKSQVEIPDGWPYLPADKRRALALRLGADNKVTVTEAEATIEAELARRAEPKKGQAHDK